MQKILALLAAIALHSICAAQSVLGLWEVKEVTVGSDVKTPVAKWTMVNEDGTYQSGNGWLQNSEGTWSYDKLEKSYLPVETNGIVDKYGAFKVSFKDTQMIWEREEDDLHVTVTLERIKQLPKSTADIIVGLWSLKEVVKNDKSSKASFDPNNIHYIFIRWDRIYVERAPNGERGSGYWHMNAHRPEVTLLSHAPGKKGENWAILVNETELRMTGLSDSNKDVVMVYTRIHEFPK